MRHDLPTPNDIFEELADKTAVQIDRFAPVAFDKALLEMLRYHRFLLALNASKTTTGAAFNYAELTGDGWNAPHHHWIRQYRRLFDRAMDRLPEDDHFITALSYAPEQLLPRPGDQEVPPNIIRGVLGIATIMIHRVEAWVTRRKALGISDQIGAERRLAHHDARTYEIAMQEIVGAWEQVLQRAPAMYGWKQGRDAAESWSAFRASWPLLQQHLANTAHCLAAAVWNEDETASVLYRESLLRWGKAFSYLFDDTTDLRWPRVLFPGLLQLDWPEASARAMKLAYEYMPPAAPGQIFSSILRSACRDVVLLTAALLLFWTIEKKQAGDGSARNAWALLNGEEREDDEDSSGGRLAFRTLFLDVLRLDLAGEPFREGTYAAELDGIVHTLDNMTERSVVPGRLFTPSPIRDRSDLLSSFAIMLGAIAPANGDDGLVARIAELSRDEDILPQGDRSLRSLVDHLGRFSSLLETSRDQFAHGLSLLAPDRDAEAVAGTLRRIADAAKATIEEQRLERLRSRPVAPHKLEIIRSAIQAALLNEPPEVHFFRKVKVARGATADGADLRDIAISGIPKAQLTDPPMAATPTRLEESFVTLSRRRAGDFSWDEFRQRPRTPILIESAPDTESFWRRIEPLVVQVTDEPILVISQAAEAGPLRKLMRVGPADRPPLKIERRQVQASGGTYVGTVEGVDVFAAGFRAGTAWLFSSRALRCIGYAPVGPGDRCVTVDFEQATETNGILHVRIRPRFEWSAVPIFELTFPSTPVVRPTA